MAKATTSGKQRRSLFASLKRHDPYPSRLKNPKRVKEVLVDALMCDDLEVFQDVLIAYLRTVSKSRLAARTKLGRQTLYDLIDETKEFNPTLSTLGSILKTLAA